MDTVVYLIISLPFLGLGYLIWQKGFVGLLAGFNEETFQGDVRKVAKAGGQTAYTIAAGLIICSILTLFIGDYTVIPLAVLIIGAVLRMNIQMKRIEREGIK
ncbi:DUF3784 domain-containing protein [Lysinibacillus odysseyi]|uniref:DUF3784 domain-containing protein n=1 Tax=Lysinibacillus odysseyi TaxID=202611 RepID=UPI00056000E0|nr:DUF3784 domain-containing protein [Lysinibacillus odysseyi]